MALTGSAGWFSDDRASNSTPRRPSPVAVMVGTPRTNKVALLAARKASGRAGGPLLSAGAGAALVLSVAQLHLDGLATVLGDAAGAVESSVKNLGAALLSSSSFIDSTCGAAACGSMDLAYGIDTLKVRLQTGSNLFEGGIRGMYAGVGASAAFRLLHGAIYMPVYEDCKHKLQAAQAPLAAAVVASATAATVLVSLVEVPVEALLLRIKSGRAASGFMSAARSALMTPGGVGALYFGAGPFIARHVLYESLEFLTYETLRARAIAAKRAGGELHAEGAGGHSAGLRPAQAALMAFAASCVATVASQPLDCIRVTCSLSAAGGGAGAAHGAHVATAGGMSAMAAVRSIVKARGVAGLFTGLLPRLATLAPGAIIFFSVFESSKSASLRLRDTLVAEKEQKLRPVPAAEPLLLAPADMAEAAGSALATAVEELAVSRVAPPEPVLALASAK